MEVYQAPSRKGKTPRTKVLIVANPDGYIEIFGNRDTDVCFVQKLDTSPAGETLAEHYLELQIPRRYKPLFFPGYLRGAGQCERRTVEDEADRRFDVDMLTAIRGLDDMVILRTAGGTT